ncbi:MAG: DUF4382 domain-containing protein [Acidobacteriota bacterium]
MKILRLSGYTFFAFLLGCALFYLPACSDSDNNIFKGSGQLEIAVTDVPIDSLSSVLVTISSITVAKESDGIWVEEKHTFDPPVTVDLLQYRHAMHQEFTLPETISLEDGTYKLISVYISHVTVINSNQETVLDMDLTEEQGTYNFADHNQTIIFSVVAGQVTTLLIDIDCESSVIYNGGYSFTPNMSVLEIRMR